ncbi:benzoate 4-monooxygenase cytochrome p450 [Penicillium cataractarum]|uniref:Benzoate 4-monooxygenase cytochrome p450 n=1 Tax=Penicillium cataractarum TaxID=2100454 RepID=A0A9X0B5N1_9EURO|nr:benzoate 4-monooxygenase cytochrome p450 [Penicillium cataractarum]KAJ5389089.1 benzoate 4-monooxygenase cytochrome p450 [Penicillium cataractarum]
MSMLLIWGTVLGASALVIKIIYTYFFSPLSHIPNAGLLAPISRFMWEFPLEYRGQLTLELPKIHKRLGPLVRIGPNEVSFYSLDIYKRVHAPNSAFIKDPRVYGQFVQDGHPALFSITDSKEHAQRRRHMGVLFNRSRVPALIPMMLDQIFRFNDLLAKLYQKGPIDLVPTCRALEADVVSRFAFGSPIGAIDSLNVGKELSIVKENDLKSSKMPLYTKFPFATRIYDSISSSIFDLIGWDISSVTSSRLFDTWANDQLDTCLDSEKAPDISFLKVMAGPRLSPQSALSEAKEMLGPGTDTTSATLAHILWALSLNKNLQNQLFQELEAAQWPTDMSLLESLPLLVACVKEGIRWTGAAAAMLPRIVPKGGTLLDGKYIEGGTMIASSPIWYLHDEVAFPDPHKYRPGRWLLNDTNEATKLRNEYYIPFSKGPGTFAYLELFLSVSQILKEYLIEACSDKIVLGNVEAVLPLRREWVAAVPTGPLHVSLRPRSGLHNKNATYNNHFPFQGT